jgi:hypothetical protein
MASATESVAWLMVRYDLAASASTDVRFTPDIDWRESDARQVPIAEMGVWPSLVDKLISDGQHRRRDGETKLFCST